MRRPLLRRLVIGALVLGGISVVPGLHWGRLAAQPAPPLKSADPPLARGDNLWQRLNPTLPGLDDTAHPLDQWRGKVLLINFWASWCAPCQYEIPDLVALQTEYAEAGLQVIGIGLDQARPLGNVARSLGINYPVLVADGPAGGRLLQRLGNPGRVVPYSVVVDRDGTLAHTHLGEVNREVFDEYVVPLLARP